MKETLPRKSPEHMSPHELSEADKELITKYQGLFAEVYGRPGNGIHGPLEEHEAAILQEVEARESKRAAREKASQENVSHHIGAEERPQPLTEEQARALEETKVKMRRIYALSRKALEAASDQREERTRDVTTNIGGKTVKVGQDVRSTRVTSSGGNVYRSLPKDFDYDRNRIFIRTDGEHTITERRSNNEKVHVTKKDIESGEVVSDQTFVNPKYAQELADRVIKKTTDAIEGVHQDETQRRDAEIEELRK